MIGNFLSEVQGPHSASEDLALVLTNACLQVFTASHRRRRISRLADMLASVMTHRRRYAVAIVSVYSGPAFLWAEATSILLQVLGKRMIAILDGGALPRFAQRHPQRVRRLLKRSIWVVAPSEYLAQAMRLYREDIRVIPNGIFLQRYPFRVREPRPRLLWLRSFHEIYKPSVAVDTVALLRTEFPDVTLEMVGPDKGDGSLERCRKRAVDQGVADLVTFRGAVPKDAVPEVLARGDIFLNTSSVDNTPVSVIEAMASGLCVVSTNVGGIPYLMRHDTNGLLVPPNDPVAMAAAVARLLRERGTADRLSNNARATVADFDFPTIVRQWCSVIEAAEAF